MPRTHAPYPPEFRRQMVELVRAGRSVEGLAPGVRAFKRPPFSACLACHGRGRHVQPCRSPRQGVACPRVPADCFGNLCKLFTVNELRI